MKEPLFVLVSALYYSSLCVAANNFEQLPLEDPQAMHDFVASFGPEYHAIDVNKLSEITRMVIFQQIDLEKKYNHEKKKVSSFEQLNPDVIPLEQQVALQKLREDLQKEREAIDALRADIALNLKLTTQLLALNDMRYEAQSRHSRKGMHDCIMQ